MPCRLTSAAKMTNCTRLTDGLNGVVIGPGQGPGESDMTLITLSGRENMAAPFAGGANAIMTGATGLGFCNHTMIKSAQRRQFESNRAMTGITAIGGGQVPGGLTIGKHIIMTGITGLGQGIKNTANMAALTTYYTMRPFQRITGNNVIKGININNCCVNCHFLSMSHCINQKKKNQREQ